MYILRTVQLLAVAFVVFRPICSEQMVGNDHNSTEKVLNATNQTIKDNSTKALPPTVDNSPGTLHRISVQDTEITGKNPRKDTSIKASGKLNSTSTTISSTVVSSSTQKSTTHHNGREGVTDKPVISNKNKTEPSKVTINTTQVIPTNITEPHGIVPKKGVTFNVTVITKQPENVTSTTVRLPTTTLKPKKPNVTIGSHDEDQQNHKNSSTVKIPTIEYYQQNNSNTQNFVIPIVAVILSVPIVALVINILYKRGKEWWSHRHYRRMDFLVDGMYNN